MAEATTEFYSPEVLKVLKAQLESVSDETWHKIMNPMCGTCIAERGKQVIEQINNGTYGRHQLDSGQQSR